MSGNYLQHSEPVNGHRVEETRKGRYQYDEIRKKTVISEDHKKVISKVPTDISDDLKQEVVSTLIISYSGPLPPPEMLKTYHEVNPEYSVKIMEQAEEEHRNYLTELKERADTDNKIMLRGQLLSFGIVFTSLIAGIILIVLGEKLFGAFLAFGPLAALFINREFQHRFKPDK